jgi:hypothetical protein
MSTLAVNEILSFTELKAFDRDDRRQSQRPRPQARRSRLPALRQGVAGRTPRTDFRLSAAGRRALEKYLDQMEALIRATRRRA